MAHAGDAKDLRSISRDDRRQIHDIKETRLGINLLTHLYGVISAFTTHYIIVPIIVPAYFTYHVHS